MKTALLVLFVSTSILGYSQTKLGHTTTHEDISKPKVSLESNVSISTLYSSLKDKFEFIISDPNMNPLITREILELVKENQKKEEVIIRLNEEMSIRIFPTPT